MEEQTGTEGEPGGSRVCAIIAFIGFLILLGGLIAYLYVVEFQIGFSTSTVYPHRDLGTALIPTGAIIMTTGIILYAVKRR